MMIYKNHGNRFFTGAKLLSIVLTLGIVSALLSGCQRVENESLPGYLEADFIYISSNVSGFLNVLDIQRGDPVAKEERLFQLDGEKERNSVAELQFRLNAIQAKIADAKMGQRAEEIAILDAQIAEAEKVADYAKLELDRSQDLREKGANTVSELDFSKNSYERAMESLKVVRNQKALAEIGQRQGLIEALEQDAQALQAQLKTANWMLQHSQQFSAIDAIVHDTLYEPGEFVKQGSPVVVLRSLNRVKVVFFIPSHLQSELSAGDQVEIRVGQDEKVAATVRYISTRAEYTPPVIYSRELSEMLLFRVEAEMEGPLVAKYNPGAPVQVFLSEGE